MIRVRYKDLSPGLHGQAEWTAKCTTVYLLPGLTGGQRRAALRRLRLEASRGCGPALPGPGLTMALAADRLRVGLRSTVAVIRVHPAGSLLPAALAGLLMTLFVFASVSARMVPLPPASAGGNATAVGAPVLVQESRAVGPASAAGVHRTSHVGQGQSSWSLVASSSQPKPSHRRARAAAAPATSARPWWRVSAMSALADWGDTVSVNADWGDAPSLS